MQGIDENAFIAAYDEYAEPLFRYCYYRVYDRERARDLMQETFTNAWEYLRSGKYVDNLRAFLYRTAHNLSVNEIARKKPLSLDEMREAAGFDPSDSMRSPEADAEASQLLDTLQRLRPDDREVLTLRYSEGLEVQEIAQMLGESPNTISVRIKRALERLRKELGTDTP